VTSNQQPGTAGEPTPGVPAPGQQPYPPQQYPPQQYPPQQYPPQQYPPQQYPPQQSPPQPYPPAYPGQQPYPAQQPYGPAGQPPYGSAGQPPYDPAGRPPRKPKGKGPLILGITGGVAALAIVASFLVPKTPVLPVTPRVPGSTASVPGASVPPVPQTDNAQAAVKGYLEALAAGDAATALAYAETPPADTTMLTNEALVAALAAAPITAINVPAGTGGSTSADITADYKLGDRTVSADFNVTKQGNLWRLYKVTSTAHLDALNTGEIPLLVNGVAVTGNEVELFPGSYTLSVGNPRYQVNSATFLVESPTKAPDASKAKLALSDAGKKEIIAAARAHLSSCLKVKKLVPPGCGFATRLPSGNKPRLSTLKWTVTRGKNALKTMKLTIPYGDPGSATAYVSIGIRGTLSSTNGRRWKATTGIYNVLATLDGADVAVTFPR
jgi:hypothetical protein